MSVVIETTLGDVTVDLYLSERPRACLNFLKLCKIKYYNFNLFHTISRGFVGQTGDPTGSRTGGESIFGVIDGPTKRYFEAESEPRIKHTRPGLISFVGSEKSMIGSQFFLTLGEDLTYLDDKHCVFGEVVEGFEILEEINEVICDKDDRPYQDVRITHTIVLDDPYPDPKGLRPPSRSPSPSAERLAGGRIAPDEEIDENTGKSNQEIMEMQAEREAKARATILEMVGDIPDAEMAPPENVLFVCKLNPVTTDDDLEIIFSRFGTIKSCEVIRDRKSGDSLQYAFIEFEEQKSCEDAYFKMGNVLIDDRRIHVDFSQSVSKVKWLGKGRGVAHFDEKGNKRNKDANNEIGKGHYKTKNGNNNFRGRQTSPLRDRRQSPRDNKKDDRYRRNSRSPRRRLDREAPARNDTRYRRNSRSPKREQSRYLARENNSYRRNSNWSSEANKRSLRSPRRFSPRPMRRDDRNRRNSKSPRRSRSPRHSNQRRSPERHIRNDRDRRTDRSTERPTRKNERLPPRSQKHRLSSMDRKHNISDDEPKIIKSKKKKAESSEDSSSDSSSTESSSEEEKKKKKSKNKKPVVSKKSSSSSTESSSEEEKKKKKSKNKKPVKSKKSKKRKKKYSSSSSDSSSSSGSNSDTKKSKKKKSN